MNFIIHNIRLGKKREFLNSVDQKGDKKKLVTLKQGKSFGIYGFFTGIERIVSAQSNKFSTVIKIDRKKMLEILSESPRDFEKFMEVKDKIYFDCNFQNLNLNCFICKSESHLFEKCDLTHFDKKNPNMYQKFNYSVYEQRGIGSRKQAKEKNIKQNIELHVTTIYKLREEYMLYEEDDDEDEDADYQEDDSDEYNNQDIDKEYYDELQYAQGNSKIFENLSQQIMQEKDENEQNNNKNNNSNNNSNNKIINENYQNNLINNNNNNNPPVNYVSPIIDDENRDERKACSDFESIIEKESKNEKLGQDSITSSLELQSISRQEDLKTPDPDQQEIKNKKSHHFLLKKQDKQDMYESNERIKSQETINNNKSKSSIKNDFSFLECDDVIQKKGMKIKNLPSPQKRRQSQSITIQTLEKQSSIQEDLLLPPSGYSQISKNIPMQLQGSDLEVQSRRLSTQQKIRNDKVTTKIISQSNKRVSIRQQNRTSFTRNIPLSNALNQQLLFKKIGSQFQAVPQNPDDEIPLYWRMESMKNYLVYYPEFNSNDVIKRVQVYQTASIRKKLKLLKKCAHNNQITQLNLNGMKTTILQGNKVPHNYSTLISSKISKNL